MAFLNIGANLTYFSNASDVIDGFVDSPYYQTGTEMRLVLKVGAVLNHNSAATAPNRGVILRSGANFTAAGRARLIVLYYGSNDGVNFFWVQPE